MFILRYICPLEQGSEHGCNAHQSIAERPPPPKMSHSCPGDCLHYWAAVMESRHRLGAHTVMQCTIFGRKQETSDLHACDCLLDGGDDRVVAQTKAEKVLVRIEGAALGLPASKVYWSTDSA